MTAAHLSRPSAKNRKKAEATPSTQPLPPIKRLPGFWTHDPRYQVDPAQRIEGGFVSEWERLRKEGA